MYAKYTWLATATEAQVRADLVALATGTTDINSLSASCDKAFTSIVANTTTTNWTVHDAAASATSQVLRSLNADGTTYKYAQFTLNAGQGALTGWETWNQTTHVGTNQTSSVNEPNNGTLNVQLSYVSPGSIYIFSTPRYLVISVSAALKASGCVAVVEFSRDSNSLGSSYPCHGLISDTTNLSWTTGTYNSMGICRIKSPTETGDLTGSAIAGSVTTMLNLNTNINVSQPYQSLGVGELPYYTVLPIILKCAQGPSFFGVLGKVQGGLLLLPNNVPTFTKFDEMVINSVTYALIGTAAGALMIPKV